MRDCVTITQELCDIHVPTLGAHYCVNTTHARTHTVVHTPYQSTCVCYHTCVTIPLCDTNANSVVAPLSVYRKKVVCWYSYCHSGRHCEVRSECSHAVTTYRNDSVQYSVFFYRFVCVGVNRKTGGYWEVSMRMHSVWLRYDFWCQRGISDREVGEAKQRLFYCRHFLLIVDQYIL